MKRLLLTTIVISMFVSLAFPFNIFAEKSYTFGIHPFKQPTELLKMFSPLIKHLEGTLSAKIKLRRAATYDDAMNALVTGKVDISYLGPAPYAILDIQYPGKIRIAAAILNKNKPTFKGVIIVKKDSSIKNLKDLKGKKIAFGDRESTLSCYMPAYSLMQAGVFDSVSYSFHGKHKNVAIAVYRGKADAGGLKPAVAKKLIAQGLGIKIIAETDPVYEHMIVVGPSVDDATYQKIRKALLNMKDVNVYKSIKKSLTGFTEVSPSDYDNLKRVIKAVDAKIKK